MVEKKDYEYDYFVIGGGSGGLASSKEAALFGKKVGIADYIVPTPIGTKWGLGGTCVNVGCIPKKLMHYCALRYEEFEFADKLGYPDKIEKKHLWTNMVKNIQQFIKKLNFGYKTSLRSKKVDYFNCYASLIDNHKILLKDAKGKEQTITADKILIAAGGRPNYGDYPGSKECCITSDDIFSLKEAPGKTLVVGGSYIALECAGFLSSLGYETTLMVRSILLRGFDQQIAGKIGEYMERRNNRFIYKAVPSKFTKNESNGKIIVDYKLGEDLKQEEYDTVLLAIGRRPHLEAINADKIGLKLSKNGKLIVNEKEQTNIDNIYSIGDCAEGRPELTPPAIHAGRLLARRLFNNSNQLMNYKYIATTVFTPLEYGCVGYQEDEAIEEFGKENIKVYHSEFTPLEWNMDLLRGESSYLKIICNAKENEKVIGFHILSPNAGEITQGMSVAINAGVTKSNLNNTVGIHPTVAEEITTCNTLKEGDEKAEKEDC